MNARNLNVLRTPAGWLTQSRQVRDGWIEKALEGALRAGARVRLWARRSWQRRQLRALLTREPRFFLDIGVSRGTVYNEASKWFWQG